MCTGIPPETFLLTNEELDRWKQLDRGKSDRKYYLKGREIYTAYGPNPPRSSEILHLIDYKPNSPRTEQFVEDYSQRMISLIQRATQSIHVVEYLGKGSNKEPGYHLKSYERAHESIFEAIEKTLVSNSKLQYTRILALPREEYFQVSSPHVFVPKENEHRKFEAIKLLSLASFKHIYNCLKNHDDGRVKFCIALASRPVHFGIIKAEATKIVVTEYYRYDDPVHVLAPDIMFIEEFSSTGKSPLHGLCRRYEQEIERDLDTGLHLIQDTIHRDINLSYAKFEHENRERFSSQKMLDIMSKKKAYATMYDEGLT